MDSNADILARLDAVVSDIQAALGSSASTSAPASSTTPAPTATPTSTSTLSIVASARVYGDPPHLEVIVDGVSAGKFDVTADHDAKKNQILSVPGSFDKAKSVQIKFTNSGPKNGMWSWGFVHAVTLNGKTILGPKGANTASGNRQAEDFDAAVMCVPGSVTFDFSATASTPASTSTPAPAPASTSTATPTQTPAPATGATATPYAGGKVTTLHIIGAGDSILCGSANGTNPWGALSLPFPWTVKDFSFGGAYSGQHTGINLENELAAIGPTATNVWIHEAGTNDLAQHGTADGLMVGIGAAMAKFKKAGATVALATLLPRQDSTFNPWSTDMEAERVKYNDILRSGKSGADFIIDVASEPTLSAAGATGNPQIYFDGLHPSAGYSNNCMVPVYSKAIAAFFGGSSSATTPPATTPTPTPSTGSSAKPATASTSTASTVSAPATTSPSAGMKLLASDDFATGLDPRWLLGIRPDKTQWGSAAHFVTASEPEAAETYALASPSVLRIRAVHRPAYKDPEGWNRAWTSGLLCSAQPDGTGIGMFRRGYVEAKVKFPTGKGRWPALWATDFANDLTGAKKWGAVEIDMEWYNQELEGVAGHYYVNASCIDWLPTGGQGSETTQNGILVDGANQWLNFDMSSDFHTIGIWVGDTTVRWFLDGKQLVERKLPRADKVGPFYWMLNLGLTSDWPVSVPPEGYSDLLTDYVKIWSAD